MIQWDINQKNNFSNIKDMVKMNIIMKKMKCIKIQMLKNNNSRQVLITDLESLNNNKKKKKKISKILIIQVLKILDSNKKKHKVLQKINFRILHSLEISLNFQINKKKKIIKKKLPRQHPLHNKTKK